jgi:hypothetical protein
LFGGRAAVAALAERLGLRLLGRARGAARLELTITGGGERLVQVTAARATSSEAELARLIAPLVDEGPPAIAKLRVVVVGEAVVGAAGGAEGDGAEGDLAELPIDARSAALASSGTAMLPLASLGHLAPLAPVGRSQPWQLRAPYTLRAERRDAHRRTRRARQRRTVALAQSQLFANLDG